MRALLLTLLAVLPLECGAAPFAVRLGEERVVLDAPAGFADTLELGSPRLLELAQALTSASNRLLLFALTDGDVRRFSTGETPEFQRYLLVGTPRALQRESLGLSQFRSQMDDAERTLGEPAAPGDVRARLGEGPVGRTILLRKLRRTPLLFSTLSASRLPPRVEGEVEVLLYTTTLMLVRGKALTVGVYTTLRSGADEAWLVDATQRWTDDLQRMNGR
ncbi:MAG TPA: hypothetical protein VFV84_11770 [Burkholderiales bacterium]|nr:hypothetical protein [Burkholderiales bacterium]